MKQPVAFLASVALALPLLVQAAWAQPSPALMAQHEVSRYSTLLSLNSDQEAQATTLFTDEATSIHTMRSTERTGHKAIETAIKNGDTATIQSTAASLGQLKGEMIALNATTQAKFYALLTAEQKTKYSALRHEHADGPEDAEGRGGPGGPPPASE